MRRNLLLSLASITIFFGLLEVGLRLSGSVPTDAIRSPEVETLNAIPGLFEPGQDFIDRIIPQRPYRIQINSLGFRGAEFTRQKEPGSTRLLCLGDSFTFGHLVGPEEAFPARLEALLRQRASSTPAAVEVINGGANGFTIPDELSFLRDKALALRPDVVILVFSQNDVADLARRRPMIEVMRDYSKLKSVRVVGPTLRVLQRSAIFNSMLRSAAWVRVKLLATKTPEPLVSDDLWRTYRTQLEVFAGLVRENGARMLLVAWPSDTQIGGTAPITAQENLSGYCAELGIPYLDLTPTMSAMQAGGVPAFLSPLDWHPSPEGHEAAAAAIAARLIELGYLGDLR